MQKINWDEYFKKMEYTREFYTNGKLRFQEMKDAELYQRDKKIEVLEFENKLLRSCLDEIKQEESTRMLDYYSSQIDECFEEINNIMDKR